MKSTYNADVFIATSVTSLNTPDTFITPLNLSDAAKTNSPERRVVLNRAVLQEIQSLVQSFRSQVRNAVAVVNWLQNRYKYTPDLPALPDFAQTGPTLTFRFKA